MKPILFRLPRALSGGNSARAGFLPWERPRARRVSICLPLWLVLFLALVPSAARAATDVPPIDRGAVTVSGISSGAAMAQQLHIAWSDLFNGAGLIASVPFGCSEGELKYALGRCIGKDAAPLDVAPFLQMIEAGVAAEQLADTENLAGDPVWVFHGALDTAVDRSVSDATVALYEALPTGGVTRYETTVEAAHLFPSLDSGSACDKSISPWVGACAFDAAGELLRTLYRDLQSPAQAQRQSPGALRTITVPGAQAVGLADEALLFLPASCPAKGCRLHLVLHGCMQSREQLGDVFAERAGYLPWAAANGIVLAFPQVRPQPRNPLACWDWWGYASDDFQYRSGAQQQVLVRWLKGLIGL